MSEYAQPTAEQIKKFNQEIRYVGYSVFAATGELGDQDRVALADDLTRQLAALSDQGLVVRGIYDVSAFRADADVMFWWHAPSTEDLQAAYSTVRRSQLGAVLTPVWSVITMHRPAEFNKSHLPAFLTDDNPGNYLCVYPFVRSYDWYVLPDEERSRMLREHGLAAVDFPDIKANTLAAFALGDYEWLLSFEASRLERIVDLMRELRNTEARLHVREETPFFTGPRRNLADIITTWR